jgi:hypothetical protein
MMIVFRRFALALVLSTPWVAAGDTPADAAVEALAGESVSRLEWGLDRLRRALLEIFAIDPLTLEPSVPPYFINANVAADERRILIEIGRTLPSVGNAQARELCAEYITRVRGFLSVDKTGTPAVNGVSDLAAEYFHPQFRAAPPDPDFARALDGAVRLRALVAAPMSGVYAVCTAKLTDSPIHHIE